MHSLKSRVIGVLVVALIVAGISAIALSGLQVRQPAAVEPEEETAYSIGKDTVRIWYTDESLTDYLNYAAVNYSSENEDVRVLPVLVSGREYLEGISDASMTDEELPDLFIATNDTLEKAHLAGLAETVTPPEGTNITDVFPETAINAVTYNDNIIAYPMFMECSALCINTTYLNSWARTYLESEIRAQMAEEAREKEESGEKTEETDSDKNKTAAGDTETKKDDSDSGKETEEKESEEKEDPVSAMVSDEDVAAYISESKPDTLEKLLELSDNFDAPENVDTIFKWAVTDIFYNYFFIGDSINVGGAHGDDPSQIDIYNEDAIRGLSAYQDLNRFFSISTDDVSYQGVIDDFKAGRILMTIVTTDAVKTLGDAGKEGEMEFEYEFLPLPDMSDTIPARSMSVTDAVVVNGYSVMKEAANDFAYYLTTSDPAALYEWTGKVSVLKNASFGDRDDEIKVFLKEYDRSVPLPKMLETSNYWVNLEMLFAGVWDGEDANEGLKNLSEQMKMQVTGEKVTEETIVIPEEEPEEDEIIEEDSQETLD